MGISGINFYLFENNEQAKNELYRLLTVEKKIYPIEEILNILHQRNY